MASLAAQGGLAPPSPTVCHAYASRARCLLIPRRCGDTPRQHFRPLLPQPPVPGLTFASSRPRIARTGRRWQAAHLKLNAAGRRLGPLDRFHRGQVVVAASRVFATGAMERPELAQLAYHSRFLRGRRGRLFAARWSKQRPAALTPDRAAIGSRRSIRRMRRLNYRQFAGRRITRDHGARWHAMQGFTWQVAQRNVGPSPIAGRGRAHPVFTTFTALQVRGAGSVGVVAAVALSGLQAIVSRSRIPG